MEADPRHGELVVEKLCKVGGRGVVTPGVEAESKDADKEENDVLLEGGGS